jgi:hypothetical protein
MDFEFDDEHELFRKSLEKFVENEVLPVAQEMDEKGKFPHELFKKAGELRNRWRQPDVLHTLRGVGQRFVELCRGSDDAGYAEHSFSIQVGN